MVLEDLLRPDLRLVICGTAAGTRSAARRAYYAGPGNKFWRTLHTIRLTPRQLRPEEFRELVTFGIGLTDLVKDHSGSDAQVAFKSSARAQLTERLHRFQPKLLCFNGKRAAQEYFKARIQSYGLRAETVGVTKFFVAPSTSGAANGFWDPLMWKELGDLVRRSLAS